MKGFWFSKADKRLRYGDGRPAKVGITHTVEGELEMCEHGLHGSKKLIDTLEYAPGNILWLCDFGGDTVEGRDKFVARSRTYLAEFDATELLKEFARKCALRVIHLAEKNFRSPEDYQIVLNFLETNENAARAASAAAYAAAYAATARVANAAAYATTARVANAAAYAAYITDAADAAYFAANFAANAVVYVTTYADEREWQNETLTQMVKEATGWEI